MARQAPGWQRAPKNRRRHSRRQRVAVVVVCLSMAASVIGVLPGARAATALLAPLQAFSSMVGSLVGGLPGLQPAPGKLVSVEPVSQHRLLATFDRDPSGSATSPDSYTISGPSGPLALTAIAVLGNQQALMSTGEQQAVTYEIVGPAASATPIAFTGSTAAEPALLEAKSLSPTRVALTFSEPMGAGALEASNYQVQTSGDSSSAATSPSGLTVSAANPGPVDTQVVLTTSTQAAVTYVVAVSDIRDLNGTYLDPTANKESFHGIPQVDTTPPRLLSAAAEGPTGALLTFDKPLSFTAAELSRYSSTPDLFLNGATLLNGLTQVLLNTGAHYAVPYTVVANVTDAGGTAINPTANSATFTGSKAVGTDRPRVVSATSTGNSAVVLQFSKPMADNATDVTRLAVRQEAPGVGTLDVLAARFVEPDRLSVELTTSSQSEVNFRASVANVTDIAGNPMADKTIVGGNVVDPTAAFFLGTAPTGDELVDTDGDTLSDHEESVSREVAVRLADGRVAVRHVTSNPNVADTDGDGLDDFVEKGLGSDPRDNDTDDDGLDDYVEFNEIYSDPLAQDTDADGLTDGLEVTFFSTSATLADSDGDQIPDGVEANLANRNPKVADLPLPGLDVGEMRLELDVRFTETTATETKEIEARTEGVSLTESRRQEWGSSESLSFEAGLKLSQEAQWEVGEKVGGTDAGQHVKFSMTLGSEQHKTTTKVFGQDERTAREAIEAYQNSLMTSVEATEGATVNREVRGARMQAAVFLRSTGDIAFTLRNPQLTAVLQDPQDPTRLVPIATLLPTSEPASGFNLGPLTPERGPILFANDQIFPNLVEDLMRNPRGLEFRFANYDITDELGRNFAFTSQEVVERTAAVFIDYGGFDGDGDGRGDDAEVLRVATGIGRRFDSNSDGVIDNSDRKRVFDENGRTVGITLRDALAAAGLGAYDESETPSGSLSEAEKDRSYSTMTNEEGTEFIYRVRRTQMTLGEPKSWEILTPTGIDSTLTLDEHIVQAGDQFSIAFLQDLDQDGLPALVEFANNCIDSPVDLDRDGRPDMLDTDGDGLDDRFEVFGGWTVDDPRGQRKVFSRCNSPNSDNDELFNAQGQLVRALSDLEEAPGRLQRDARGRVAFKAGQQKEGEDFLPPSRIGSDDFITDASSRDTDGDGIDDVVELNGFDVHIRFPEETTKFVKTNPELFDTDTDNASDGLEVLLGGDPTVFDPEVFRDSDGDGLVDAHEDMLFFEIEYEENSTAPATCDGTCLPGTKKVVSDVKSDKHLADSDGDGLNDAEEWRAGTNPKNADTDGDGLSDFEEVRGFILRDLGIITTDPLDADSDNDKRKDGAEADRETDQGLERLVIRVPGKAPYQAFSHPNDPDGDLDRLVDGDEYRAQTDPAKFNTDGDSRSDYDEVVKHRRAFVPDVGVKLTISKLEVIRDGDDDATGEGPGDFEFKFGIQDPVTLGTVRAVSSLDFPLCSIKNVPYCRDENALMPIQSTNTVTFDPTKNTSPVVSISTSSDLFEQLRIGGALIEYDGGAAKDADCSITLPDATDDTTEDSGVIDGNNVKLGTHTLNLARTVDCVIDDDVVKFKLYATYTAD
jgi:hypothetical protein